MREKLTNIFKTYGFYLWPILVMVVILIVFVKIDSPKIAEINAIRRELSGIKERLTKLSAKSILLSSLDEGKLKADYEKVNLVLPDGKDAPSILRTLEVSASSSGVFLENLDLAPGKLATKEATKKDASNEIPLKVTVRGTIPQITTYLREITSVGRILGFKNLEISLAEGTASAKVNLELVAYFLLPPPSVGGGVEELPTLGASENDVLTKIASRELLAPTAIISPAGKIDLFK